MVMFEIWSLGEKPFPNLTVNEVCLEMGCVAAPTFVCACVYVSTGK